MIHRPPKDIILQVVNINVQDSSGTRFGPPRVEWAV